jgi:isoquinoline 1-oxidoreductase alpha subunit
VKLNVNGADAEVDDRFTGSPLLWVLRDVLELHGPKYGCGIGFCAACTVLIDGQNARSCQTPAGTAVGKAVTTVEGASGPVIDAIRDAWYRGNVVQCGYCQPGQTLAAAALLAEELDADFASVRVVSAANGVGPQGDVYGTPAGGGFIQLTGASTGTKGFWDRYRLAAARARARLAVVAAAVRCPRATPGVSPAAASSTATAPRSPRSPSTAATGSASRRLPSRSTAAS